MATDLISDDEDLLVAPACAPVPACVVPCVSTDIFSDDEDQPVSASLAVPPPVNVPAELRSVVVAEMDLVDSDEEQIEALQVPGAESQHLAAKPETIPPSLAAGLVVAAPSQTTTAEKSGDSDDDFNLTGLEARGPHDSHGTVDGTKRKAEVGDDAKDNIKRRAESAKPEDAKPKEKEKKTVEGRDGNSSSGLHAAAKPTVQRTERLRQFACHRAQESGAGHHGFSCRHIQACGERVRQEQDVYGFAGGQRGGDRTSSGSDAG